MLSIGIGSKTSTGGVVIEGNDNILFNGLIASSVGQKATCPACKKGVGPIVAVGERTSILPAGPAARAGDYVACGCPAGSNVLLPAGTITIGSGQASAPVTVASPSRLGATQRKPLSSARAQTAPDVAPAGSQFANASTTAPPPLRAQPEATSDQAQHRWKLDQSDYFNPATGLSARGRRWRRCIFYTRPSGYARPGAVYLGNGIHRCPANGQGAFQRFSHSSGQQQGGLCRPSDGGRGKQHVA